VRQDGYAPIRDYAVIGDGRTAALVALDGSIDWLCLPNVDSGSVFGRILDARRGGSFELQPDEPFESKRRYQDGSNVLETTFRTSSGVVRVTDAMTLVGERLAPTREVVRKIEGLTGRVPMRWRVEPRFDFARERTRVERRAGRPFAVARQDAFALGSWEAGEPQLSDDAIEGRFVAEAGTSALLDLAATHQEPAVLPCRDDVERRLERTVRFWPSWSARARYDGPWRDAVNRSVLALKLCVFSPSGAIVAAPTTSLPEWIGAGRNWDYRFTWLRDASFALDALLRLGYEDEAASFFWWFMHASRLTHPRLQILYRVDGGHRAVESEVSDLEGYRTSPPVRIGNGAADQVQLDVYGDVLDSIWRFVCSGETLDRGTAKEVVKIADYVVEIWRGPDSGIWEVRSEPTHYVHSKAMCWVALDRACKLAERGAIPAAHRARWRSEADAIREFVDSNGYDSERNSYMRATTLPELDASLLTLAIFDYHEATDERLLGTIDAVRRELADGPLVRRYRGTDGLSDEEGAFVTCSFWLADALSRCGRISEAEQLFDDLVGLANDVGLYAEEIRPSDGAFLGNFPQALVHLALVNAAASFTEAVEGKA
jgi:GH15 family glucan-1,4-alpha-glucosidase